MKKQAYLKPEIENMILAEPLLANPGAPSYNDLTGGLSQNNDDDDDDDLDLAARKWDMWEDEDDWGYSQDWN